MLESPSHTWKNLKNTEQSYESELIILNKGAEIVS